MIEKIHNRTGMSGGYTLLFAVLISSIVLGVALSILSISRRELLLSSNARESQYAFYAADSGLECAVYNDYYKNAFAGAPNPSLTCKGVSPVIFSSSDLGNNRNVYRYIFRMPIENSDVVSAVPQMCADVIVEKDITEIKAPDSEGALITVGTRATTTIDSRGYNVGWNPDPDPAKRDCSKASVRKVERSLRLVH